MPNALISLIHKYIYLVKHILPSIILFIARIWIGYIFFGGIMYKLQDYSRSIMGFTNYYLVPFLSPIFSHYISLTFEITGAALLVLGLFTRFAALPIIAITVGIIFLAPQAGDKYWLLIIFIITSFGAGKISLDHLISLKVNSKSRLRKAPGN